ncbi:hypothetical protein H5410_010587 [Solanum commersonii]|uniref:non-specific serine/threonine protein kinase n=1 Tax=Solanum commersonii TaxID=4109 RepID=A0A9J6ALV7_SOLCO|nr:hypothetical protein H5410_010587 [Solanum commersonii]
MEILVQVSYPSIVADHVNVFTLDQLNSWTNEFANMIGHGGQGTVFSGVISLPNSSLDGQAIAVKRSRITRIVGDAPIDEARTLSSIQHNHIIQVVGTCSTPGAFFLVMPLMANGSLSSQFKAYHIYHSIRLKKHCESLDWCCTGIAAFAPAGTHLKRF